MKYLSLKGELELDLRKVYNVHAEILNNLDQNQEAIKYLNKALRLCSEQKDYEPEIHALVVMGKPIIPWIITERKWKPC